MTSPSRALRICVSAVLTQRMSLWVRKEKWACTPNFCREGLLWKQVSPTLCITHFTDWSFPAPQGRAAEVSQPISLPSGDPSGSWEASHKAAFRDQLSLREDPSLGPQFLHPVSPHKQIDEGLGKSSQDLVSL